MGEGVNHVLDERLGLAVERWFRLSPAPIMIVDIRTREILAANRAAETMTHGVAFALAGGSRLLFADRHLDDDFWQQLRGVETMPAVICLRQGDDLLAVSAEAGFGDGDAHAIALTFRGELSGKQVCGGRTIWASLQKAYDLTIAEERIAYLLAEGASVPDVAHTVGITVDTVRSHVQKIYSKVGVMNREQLMIRLARLQFTAADQPASPQPYG